MDTFSKRENQYPADAQRNVSNGSGIDIARENLLKWIDHFPVILSESEE
jgi:hypothetical protein